MATSNATPVWLITGASSGLGAALAMHCIKAGHKVIGTARNVKKASQDVPDFAKLGGTWIELDVTASDVEQKTKQAAEIYGSLDVVVNNAGYSLLGALEDISDEEAHAQMETNFFGPLKVIRGALPTMRKQKSGTIVNITSVAAFDGLPTCSLYAGSKFGLEGASESLAREVAKFNIKVLLVEPGAFRTNFLSAFVPTKSGISEPYQQSPVADVMKAFEGMNGKQKGDIDKGVARIFEVVTRTGHAAGLGEILRLPLGSDCVERLEKKIESFKADLEKTRKIALSTAYVEA